MDNRLYVQLCVILFFFKLTFQKMFVKKFAPSFFTALRPCISLYFCFNYLLINLINNCLPANFLSDFPTISF